MNKASATTRTSIVVILIIDDNELLSHPTETVSHVMDVQA